MKRHLIAEQWDDFARCVLPANAPDLQRRLMRRAFYAGATALLYKVVHEFSPIDEVTVSDQQLTEDLDQELREFADAMRQGRA